MARIPPLEELYKEDSAYPSQLDRGYQSAKDAIQEQLDAKDRMIEDFPKVLEQQITTIPNLTVANLGVTMTIEKDTGVVTFDGEFLAFSPYPQTQQILRTRLASIKEEFGERGGKIHDQLRDLEDTLLSYQGAMLDLTEITELTPLHDKLDWLHIFILRDDGVYTTLYDCSNQTITGPTLSETLQREYFTGDGFRGDWECSNIEDQAALLVTNPCNNLNVEELARYCIEYGVTRSVENVYEKAGLSAAEIAVARALSEDIGSRGTA